MFKKFLECVAGAEDEAGVMGSERILGSMESHKHGVAQMGASFLETKEEIWIEQTQNVHFLPLSNSNSRNLKKII